MPESNEPAGRLDSWKAIAAYLRRDIATVARWEKTLGLPVHRVGGTGRSVFAYTAEIDAWLKTTRPAFAAGGDEAVGAAVAPPAAVKRMRTWLAAAVVILGVAGTAAWYVMSETAAGALRIEIDESGVIGRDARGNQAWRYAFPSDTATTLPDTVVPLRVVTGDRPAVYAITYFSRHHQTREVGGGVLHQLGVDGQPAHSFSFDDEVSYGTTRFGPPWAMTHFAVDDSAGTRRIAVVSHHYTWEPSLVTILDEQWRRQGTFHHAGWVEKVAWLAPDRLLIGGFSQSRNGGMVALLDAAALDGQGPEAAGSRYYCDDCPDGQPLRMIVMPRSEVNLVTGSRFNRAGLEVVGGRIVARTVGMPQAAAEGDADALYEFTPNLELVRATFTDRYWEVHRGLEAQGKLDHTRAQCPHRDGPRSVLAWDRDGGWRTVTSRPAR